jgi:hypothetical protein
MTYTFTYPTPNTLTLNIPNGPSLIELRLTSQMTNDTQVGTITTILFASIFANDRYTEYTPEDLSVVQDLSEEFIEGIYNYEIVVPVTSEILELGTIKIKNESQDNWPTAYVSTNETREGVVFAPNNL